MRTPKTPKTLKDKQWWQDLDNKDKRAFAIGYIKNKKAVDIQKQEIESNRRRYKTNGNTK